MVTTTAMTTNSNGSARKFSMNLFDATKKSDIRVKPTFEVKPYNSNMSRKRDFIQTNSKKKKSFKFSLKSFLPFFFFYFSRRT